MSNDLYYKILALNQQVHALQWQVWLENELFTYQWWLLLGLLIIPWLVWWKLVDKKRTGTILAYGIYTMFVVTAMDAIGSACQFWIYPIKLLPVVPDSAGIDWGGSGGTSYVDLSVLSPLERLPAG